LSLEALITQPFELLVEMERRAREAVAAREGADTSAEEWVGIGFRLGAESFVAARGDVREVIPVPEPLARVPGAKPWLRGIANVRGQLLTIVDLKAFLGGGSSAPDRRSRVLVLAGRDVPTALIVDEVLGFRRFTEDEFAEDAPATVARCEHYLTGGYRRGSEVWPRFSLLKLLDDETFLNAGEPLRV
jgi:twitching motility protein PilI